MNVDGDLSPLGTIDFRLLKAGKDPMDAMLNQGVCPCNIIWLVVDLPLWKMMEFVSWDDEIPNRWKNKKYSKPPTSYEQKILL